VRILVTGGVGYIGSHTVIQLIEGGHDVLIVDNLSNSDIRVLDRIKTITNKSLIFCKADIKNLIPLCEIFDNFKPEAVVHFAGLKSVSESVENSILYYDNNVSGSITLLEVMTKYNCNKIVFSSSATVYGEPKYLPYDEYHPLNPINPYGRTKLMVEQVINDWCSENKERSSISLRYFNPAGAHFSNLIGENPLGKPNNLMPYMAKVAIGNLDTLEIFGNDYNTVDGTGARDYIHVVDLASAHLSALAYLNKINGPEAFNIGLGAATTVLELLKIFEQASGKKINYDIVNRRSGDLSVFWADITKAKNKLAWAPVFNVFDMCNDTWNWQRQNKEGFNP